MYLVRTLGGVGDPPALAPASLGVAPTAPTYDAPLLLLTAALAAGLGALAFWYIERR